MKKDRIIRLTQLGLLSAIVWIMAFTPLGYLKTAGLEITFIMIPVCVGAILLGPAGGAILGLEFGITSFVQCFGLSVFGTALFSINPVFTFIVCIVPRVLAGWIPGLVFRAFQRAHHPLKAPIPHVVSSLAGALSNTVFFMGALVLFFWHTEYLAAINQQLGTSNVVTFILAFIGLNGAVEIAVAMIIGPAVSIAVERALRHLS